jgi:hypothetical protein
MSQVDKKQSAATVTEFPKPLSLAEMFRREQEQQEAPPTLRSALPTSAATIRRSARTLPVPALDGLVPFWCLVGRGNAGKTTLARALLSEIIERQVSRYVIAALDPGQRLLAEFAEGVMVPPSTDPAETVEFLRTVLAFVMQHRVAGFADLGGGNTALDTLIRAAPTLAREMENVGVALVPAYFLVSPDDPALLGVHADIGFAPRATALVLNMNNAATASVFDAIRAHPAYRAALDRGAVEIILPRLEPARLAQRIEARRFHFFQARDGVALDGMAPLSINALERAVVRQWIENVRRELQPVEAAGWLPWSA